MLDLFGLYDYYQYKISLFILISAFHISIFNISIFDFYLVSMLLFLLYYHICWLQPFHSLFSAPWSHFILSTCHVCNIQSWILKIPSDPLSFNLKLNPWTFIVFIKMLNLFLPSYIKVSLQYLLTISISFSFLHFLD